MPMTPRKWRPNFSRLRWLAAALALLAAAACTDDRGLIDRTLDRRAVALNNKDVDGYVALLSPDYVKSDPKFDPRAYMTELFQHLAGVNFQVFSRTVTFEPDGRARVVQEYRMVLTWPDGRTQTLKGADHFMMKPHSSWPFKKWLIHEGLDSRPKPPAETTPAPADAATPGGAP